MKKYVFLYSGYDASTPELEQKWHDWFTLRADSFADPGNPLGAGRSVTPDLTATDINQTHAVSGYSIVNAATRSDAEALLEGCSIVDNVYVYEALAV